MSAALLTHPRWGELMARGGMLRLRLPRRTAGRTA